MSQPSRREQLEKLLADCPTDTFLRYALAMECVAAGEVPQAILQLQELTRDAPDYVAAYQQCGQLLIQLGRQAEARPVLETGLAAARRAQDAHSADEIKGLLLNIGAAQ